VSLRPNSRSEFMKYSLLAALFILALLPALQAAQPGSLYQLSSQWKDQNGQVLQLKDLAGSPRLLVMLYTRCTTTCPLVLEDIKGLLGELPGDRAQNLKVSIFSFDSERET